MKIVLAFALACLVVAVLADADKAWKEFKENHGKAYKNKEHEAKSRMNFEKNHKLIEEHNARQATGLETYMLAHNALSDLDEEEYRRTRCGTIRKAIQSLNESRMGESIDFDSFVDVRQTGTVDYSTDPCMTPVKDQGDCGSCYAFSVVAALEFYDCKKSGIKKTFSEQQIVDCSGAYDNAGCNGGSEVASYKYLITGGIATNAAYPYSARDGTCKFTTAMKVGNVASYKQLYPSGVDTVLMTTFAEAQGPVNVAIDASLSSFQLYKSGVYTESRCSRDLNHAVLVVGYGTLNGINYWKIKNSWGTTWGLSGYMLIQRGVNRCGIAGDIAYPTV